MHRERQQTVTDRQKDRQTDRQTGRQAHIHTHTHTHTPIAAKEPPCPLRPCLCRPHLCTEGSRHPTAVADKAFAFTLLLEACDGRVNLQCFIRFIHAPLFRKSAISVPQHRHVVERHAPAGSSCGRSG